MACVNFINLATARASQRAREVALRKVLGASRGQLIAQFLGESLLLAGVAMLIALAIAELALPWLADFLAPTSRWAISAKGGIVLPVLGLAASSSASPAASTRPSTSRATSRRRVLKGQQVVGRAGGQRAPAQPAGRGAVRRLDRPDHLHRDRLRRRPSSPGPPTRLPARRPDPDHQAQPRPGRARSRETLIREVAQGRRE